MNDKEVLNYMGESDEEIYLFLIQNISRLDIRSGLSTVEITIDSEVATKISKGKMLTAFIVADKETFFKIKNKEN